MKLNSNNQGSFGNKKGFGLKRNNKQMPKAYYVIFIAVVIAVLLIVCFLPFDLEGKTAAFFFTMPVLAFVAVFIYNVILKKRK